jgi:phospholipid/cholesterol/gamma-HCH transport system substrate-binding protein
VRTERRKRLPNWAIGLILVVVVGVLSVYAFTKSLPWADKYTVEAVFTNAGNVRPASPVRIAGVNVGKVTSVEHLAPDDPAVTAQADPAPTDDGPVPSTATVVTMELDESALPLHTDATMKLRPRLFLEGNLFVDLKPGSPNAPEADDGHVFPAGQTAVAVALDQVLTTLQGDVRNDLQVLLDQFGNALDKYGGSEGLRELYRSSPGAFRYTSQVNEALLGQEPHDLSDLIVNLDSTVEALGRNEGDLQDLVTNLRVVLGSFAAESAALERGIAELPRVLEEGEPALASLNRAFPAVRAFAREALPGVRSTPATLDAATPFLRQLRGLVSEDELRGLTHDLRPAIPDLARLSRRSIPLLNEFRAVSSCFNEVIIPWTNDDGINDESQPGGAFDPETPTINGDGSPARVFEELSYSTLGIASESRSGDANGPYIRVLGGGGTNTVVLPDPVQGMADPLVGVTPLPILGARPAIDSSAKTPFRPDVPCETQDPPNLDGGQAGDPPSQTSTPAMQTTTTPELTSAIEGLQAPLERAVNLLDAPKAKQANRGENLYTDTLTQLAALLAQSSGTEYLNSLEPGYDAP